MSNRDMEAGEDAGMTDSASSPEESIGQTVAQFSSVDAAVFETIEETLRRLMLQATREDSFIAVVDTLRHVLVWQEQDINPWDLLRLLGIDDEDFAAWTKDLDSDTRHALARLRRLFGAWLQEALFVSRYPLDWSRVGNEWVQVSAGKSEPTPRTRVAIGRNDGALFKLELPPGSLIYFVQRFLEIVKELPGSHAAQVDREDWDDLATDLRNLASQIEEHLKSSR